MKKILLLAVAAFVGLSPALAEEVATTSIYREKRIVQSVSELTDGKYFIKAHAGHDKSDTKMSRGEGFMIDANVNRYLTTMTTYFKLPRKHTYNSALVWNIKFTDVTDENRPGGLTEGNDKVFTIQSVTSGYYFSVQGAYPENGYPAKHNVIKTKGGTTEPAIAQFELCDMPEGYTKDKYFGEYKENTRFFIHLTNAQFKLETKDSVGNVTTSIAYPYVHTNQSAPPPIGFGYWKGASTDGKGTAVQFEFIEVEEVPAVNVKIKIPSFNGMSFPEEAKMALGTTLEEALAIQLETIQLDHGLGDFKMSKIYSDTGAETVSEGMTITVEGKWDRELVPGHVYRMRIRPHTDACGLMRYMISSGAIETRRENVQATLTRIVPERLWFLKKSAEGDTYTLHTIYDPTKAVKFTQLNGSWDHATASLVDEKEATPLDLFYLNDGTFTLRIHGQENAWFNDYGGEGYLSIYSHEVSDVNNIEDGSRLMVYPLTDEDYDLLKKFNDTAACDAAQANPTPENVKPLVDAYDANNIEAALKRVEYITTKHLGPNPGQFSDPDRKFDAAVLLLKDIAAHPDNYTVGQTNAAIADVNNMIEGMSESKLVMNQMKPGFYRFRGKRNDKCYLSSINGGRNSANKDAMSMTTDNTRSSTVFYARAKDTNEDPNLVNYEVICFDNGLVLPNLLPSSESWIPALPGTAAASVDVNFNYQNDGCYLIHTGYDADGTHRHLHDGDAEGTLINAGRGTDDPYHWYIERVTELPITFYNVIGMDGEDDKGWTSVYSPVALKIPAAYTNTTAYTGQPDHTDFSKQTPLTSDINHVLATPIAKTGEDIIIPANQPALIYFKGDRNNPNISASDYPGRRQITYLNLPVVGDVVDPSTSTVAGGLTGSFTAVPKSDAKYYTLHASHSNNFRDYSEYDPEYTFIPGFKAYLPNPLEGVDRYPICRINPNEMSPKDPTGETLTTGYKIEEAQSAPGMYHVAITLSKVFVNDDPNYTQDEAVNCELYYSHTPAASAAPMRRIIWTDDKDKNFSNKAERFENEYSFDVAPGRVDYYVYHPGTDTKSAVRSFTINSDGTTVDITDIEAAINGSVECYDLQGRKLAAPAKGLNIINGRKIFIK